jgi:glycosyltransferase involved in cell wall biosynthesis
MAARETTVPFAQRRGLAFIGGYCHAPNIDAARWLVDEIMPLVWQEAPEIECLLVGSHMPDALLRITRAGVVPLGYVPDLAAIFERVRLTVAPLRYGAGIKGKVLHSLVAGVPCVGTPIAAEGLALPPLLQGYFGKSADELASRIIGLHASEQDNVACAQAGLQLVREEFSAERVDQTMKDAIGASAQVIDLGDRRAVRPVGAAG